MNLKQYQKFTARLEELQSLKDQKIGERNRIKQELKKEFGCESTSEARNLVKVLEAEQEVEQKELDRLLKTFEKEYGELL